MGLSFGAAITCGRAMPGASGGDRGNRFRSGKCSFNRRVARLLPRPDHSRRGGFDSAVNPLYGPRVPF